MPLALNRFLLFGDSITEFSFKTKPLTSDYPDQSLQFSLSATLADDYLRKLDILHRGYGGYNSRLAKQLLPTLLKYDHDLVPEGQKIKLLYVFFGTNDAATGCIQAVPLEEYKSNMTYIVKELLARSIKVVLVGATYHDPVAWGNSETYKLTAGGAPNTSKASTETNKIYASALQEIAKENGIGFVDLLTGFEEYAKEHNVKPESLLVDGIHFTGKGYEVFYKGLKNEIKAKYPELDSSALAQNLCWFPQAVQNGLQDVLE